MSTLFAFRAATEKKLPMVTNVSFASPRVGDQKFRDEFYKLERTNRIRHLRVANDEDEVPLIFPASIPTFERPTAAPFKHTGMNLRLYKSSSWIKSRIFYPKKGSWTNEIFNGVISNVVPGLSVGVISKHLCPEYSTRLDAAEDELKKITLEGLYSDHDITGWKFMKEKKMLTEDEPETSTS